MYVKSRHRRRILCNIRRHTLSTFSIFSHSFSLCCDMIEVRFFDFTDTALLLQVSRMRICKQFDKLERDCFRNNVFCILMLFCVFLLKLHPRYQGFLLFDETEDIVSRNEDGHSLSVSIRCKFLFKWLWLSFSFGCTFCVLCTVNIR